MMKKRFVWGAVLAAAVLFVFAVLLNSSTEHKAMFRQMMHSTAGFTQDYDESFSKKADGGGTGGGEGRPPVVRRWRPTAASRRSRCE